MKEIKQFAKQLGLPENASEKEISEAIEKMKSRVEIDKDEYTVNRPPLRVLLVDDSDFILLIEDKLKRNENLIVRTIRTLADLKNQEKHNNIIILDMEFNKDKFAGLNQLPHLVEGNPEIKVLMYSTHIDQQLIKEAEQKNAKGYIFKNDINVINHIETVLNNFFYGNVMSFTACSSETIKNVLTEITNSELQDHERSVLRLKAGGLTSHEVADKLNNELKPPVLYNDRNVDSVLKKLASKWNIRNDKGAIIAKAIKDDIIKVSEIQFPSPID